MSGKIHVLLIEDKPGDARLACEALAGPSAQSFHVVLADRLSCGLDRLAGGGFDVVLLDLGLPDSHGLGTLAAIRASAAHIPVVVLSGTEDEEFAFQVVQAGAQDYLVKQYLNRHALTRALRYAIERKRGEEALRESEKVRLAIGESIDYGVWVRAPDGRNTYASESFLKLVGLTQEQCSNFGWRDVLHPDDAERTIAAWKECARTEGRWDIEHRFRGVDGEWHPVLARGVPVRDEQGRVTCWAGINLDISVQKRAEENLRQSESRERGRAAELEAVMDAAPALIFVARDAACRHISGNRATYNLLRQPPGANLSTSAPESEKPSNLRMSKNGIEIPPEELPVQKAVSSGEPVRNYEFEVVFDDGTSVNLLGDAVPLLDERGNTRGGVGVFVDNTERKRSGEALRESEKRLRLAMNVANEATREYDPASGEVTWNDTSARNFGSPGPLEDAAQWWIDRIHPDDANRVAASWGRALCGSGDAWEVEYRMRRADGSWADVYDRAVIARDPTGRPVRVVGAMLEITERKRSEEALQAANRQLRQLSQDLLRAQDYERRRIARELHDSTLQILAALSIDLSRLKDPGLAPDRREQALSEAVDLAAACATEIRTLTHLLHPPLLDMGGLVSALQAYTRGFNQRTGMRVDLEISPDFARLDSEMETTLFRIVQEGLGNVHKHSGSRVAVVRLERDSREVRLVLQDQGRGLPEAVQPQRKGFVGFGVGIMGMRERAEQLGGRLELASNDVGTRLSVTLPLVDSNEENACSVGG
jgi:PAS domain S-box-containing protein